MCAVGERRAERRGFVVLLRAWLLGVGRSYQKVAGCLSL
jgi:hypothetical protein